MKNLLKWSVIGWRLHWHCRQAVGKILAPVIEGLVLCFPAAQQVDAKKPRRMDTQLLVVSTCMNLVVVEMGVQG
jgi:hypothetical protein